MAHYILPCLGGLLIGVSSAVFLALNGRVAGISGILGGILHKPTESWLSSILFVVGLVLGPLVYRSMLGTFPIVRVEGSLPILGVAGLLVGYGTRLGSGCTSGHGVSGLARLSPRSIAAVVTFLVSGAVTVSAMRAFA
ncbi:YeeE/YedE family protein [Beijerinckia sp. L45]|uniref:YeeE/YedE family protein n=1 Tax=Beijerinckia sp. L45 TaxID=1641855 RepID=UPI00131BD934|nr:YeeE/YedE thiosulfate transporter family protein [Beijerinckia sp. L45]